MFTGPIAGSFGDLVNAQSTIHSQGVGPKGGADPLHACAVQIPRPPAIGHQSVVKQLRSVLFSEPILGAASVRPKGYVRTLLAPALGWWAPYLARNATKPLPPTLVYIAVTPVDIRLFSKPGWGDPFEIGRWRKGAYRASIRGSGYSLSLDLELERLGRVTVRSSRDARPVLELVVQAASGPVL